ncbi:uncharacterized protein SAMN04490248_12045 [Salinihabitans flavidus]|uniref:YecA family protein n=1 Tax=Salinihabitans flavidus TaxID=569882 RepID=A0A1H8UJC3_9RHOB|nr:UPF0149 family protein [Salinihabitans flavidus]SEP03063.1 uncharacterized protein SAMN04490248_12045 [Salinihabitans flavidus]
MGNSDQELDRLAALLWALPQENFPMTVSELDGYVTGILVCPEMIPPSDWLAHVWGETGEANFPDPRTAEETIAAVMAHYNFVATAMADSPWIEPIYEVDPNSDETLWEPWIDGFVAAMRLCPEAWQALLERADEEAQSSMIFLMALQDIYEGTTTFTDDEIDAEAPDMIPNCVAAILVCARPELFAAEAAHQGPAGTAKRPGRNESCPCGSGRKYKKCCGAN